jgi:hypothetical protein
MRFASGSSPPIVEQPTTVPTLNRSHPLARGLIVSSFISAHDTLMGSKLRNYANESFGSKSAVTMAAPGVANGAGSGSWLVGSSIVGSGADSAPRTRFTGPAAFDGTSSWAQLPLDLSPHSIVTVAFWLQRISGSGAHLVMEYTADAGTNNGFHINCEPSSAMRLLMRGTGTAFSDLASQITGSEWHHHIIGLDRSSTNGMGTLAGQRYWVIDGTLANLAAGSGSTTSGVAFAANGQLNIGARNAGASAWAAMQIAGLHMWNRYLRLDEAQSVYRNSWAMYRTNPSPYRMMVDAVAGGGGGGSAAHRWFLVQ